MSERVDGVNHTASPEVRREAKEMLRSTWPSYINLTPNDWQANQTFEDLSHGLAPALIVVGKHDQDFSHRVGKAMESHLSKDEMVVIDGGCPLYQYGPTY